MPVFINNVDDYLGPSQACVNPLFAPEKPAPTQSSSDVYLANGDGDGATTKKISPTTNGVKATAETNADSSSRKVVQNRRRIRQRRVPRIIQSEDSNTSTSSKIGDPIRLVNDKDNLDVSNDTSPSTTNTDTTKQIIKKKASVTLSDCLSCSGCVTSAEAVLMSHHSIDQLREVSTKSQNREQLKRIVFTISSASLADLYRHLYLEGENNNTSDSIDGNDQGAGSTTTADTCVLLSRQDFLSKLASFLHSEFGAEMLIDGALSQKISLMESASEFCYRYRKNQQSAVNNNGEVDGINLNLALSSKKHFDTAMPSVALSSTKTRYINKQPTENGAADDDTLMEITTLSHPPGRVIEEDNQDEAMSGSRSSQTQMQSTSLPMLASSCPGFVCLVEKTAPLAVPLLSSAKSPMAVAGILVKTEQCNKQDSSNAKTMASKGGEGNAKSCYHVAIMPCNDKKLEAGRGDFAWERQALLQYSSSSMKSADGTSKTSISEDGLNDKETEDLINEVDLVISTGELLEILCDAAAKLESGKSATMTKQLPSESEDGTSTTNAIRDLLARNNIVDGSCAIKTATNGANGSEATVDLELDTGVHGSGSYADYIFRYAAQELFGCKLPHDKSLPWKGSSATYAGTSAVGKSAGVLRRRRRRQETSDLREVILFEHSDGSYSCCDETNGDTGHCSTPVLRFATAYGFKNVQLVLQSLSKNESSKTNSYDYVEIMACPSGCSNGGGQIGANGQRETPRETKERVRKTVSALPIVRPTEGCQSLATALCGCHNQDFVQDSILHGECFDENARQLFHTRFHIVPKLELSTGATAGVAVSDTKW